MGSPETHLAAAGSISRTCETCGESFPASRSWARFCDDRCRNAFHGAERRLKAIAAASRRLYDALAEIAGNATDPVTADVARAAIKDLKPPVEPKALLEKAKA